MAKDKGRKSIKQSQRELDILVEAGKIDAEPHLENLHEEIRIHSEQELVQAYSSLDGIVWAEQQQYADAAHLHIRRADCFGHLEIAERLDKDIDSDGFVRLDPVEGLEYFERREIISPAEYKKADDKTKLKAFSVAKATRTFHVEKTKELIAQCLRGESNEAEFRKALSEMLGTRRRDYYIETVYRNNMQSAYQHGRYVQQHHPDVLKVFAFYEYRTVGDSRVRDSHKEMNGRVWPIDHPIWEQWYPPNGYSCRCRVDEMRETEVAGKIEEAMPGITPDKGFVNSPRDWLDRNP